MTSAGLIAVVSLLFAVVLLTRLHTYVNSLGAPHGLFGDQGQSLAR